MEDEQRYLEEVLGRVCPRCIDRDGEGGGECRLSADAECMIRRFFPQIVEAVRSVYSTSMEPYVVALREKVCRTCLTPGESACAVRDDVECALDRYFPMIVETIEEMDLAKRFASAKTGWVQEAS